MCVCVWACLCAYMYIHIHTHTSTRTHKDNVAYEKCVDASEVLKNSKLTVKEK